MSGKTVTSKIFLSLEPRVRGGEVVSFVATARKTRPVGGINIALEITIPASVFLPLLVPVTVEVNESQVEVDVVVTPMDLPISENRS